MEQDAGREEEDSDAEGDEECLADPAAGHPDRDQGGQHGGIDEDERAQQDSPADRPEGELTQEEEQPDREEERQREQRAEGDADQDRDPLDLAPDLTGLGLRQVDVGGQQAPDGVTDVADLVSKAGRCPVVVGGRGVGGTRVLGVVQRVSTCCGAGLARVDDTNGPSAGRNAGVGATGCGAPTARGGLAYHRRVRQIERAELLSIGSELTVGETRDTNAGELAGLLTSAGVDVVRMTALPDDLPAVRDAFLAALGRVDLVLSTGGLGPTPDDLTRESIAAAIGETPVVDPDLETWLRELFARRDLPFPPTNVKQAWVTPSTTPIPNDNGTAPGWWVDRPDGRVIVALPGPPREMRPRWRDWVQPRLAASGLGRRTASLTLRTTGLGESLIAERLGSLLQRDANPTVATYARADAVDVRISAFPTAGADADTLVAAAEREVLARLGDHVWGRGDITWPAAIETALATHGWRLATIEIDTRGSVAALLAEGLGERLVQATVLSAGAERDDTRPDLAGMAEAARIEAGADVVLAVRVTVRGNDMAVSVAVADPNGSHAERRLAFLGGSMGRTRAALLAAAILHARLQ